MCFPCNFCAMFCEKAFASILPVARSVTCSLNDRTAGLIKTPRPSWQACIICQGCCEGKQKSHLIPVVCCVPGSNVGIVGERPTNNKQKGKQTTYSTLFLLYYILFFSILFLGRNPLFLLHFLHSAIWARLGRGRGAVGARSLCLDRAT